MWKDDVNSSFFKKFFNSDFLLFDLALLSFFITVLISSLLSFDKTNSLIAFPLFCFYLLAHFLLRDTAKRKGGERLLNVIFLSLFFLCGIGIIQYLLNLNIDRQIFVFNLLLSTEEGITSTLGKPNNFAAFLVLALPLVLTSISGQKKNKKKQGFLFILFFLGIFSLLLTRSLGGIGTTGIVIAIYLLIKKRKIGLIVIGIGIIILFIFQSYLFTILKKYGTLNARIYTWENVSIPLIKEHPFLGVGINNYPKIAPSYSFWHTENHAHNLYLHYLGEMGFIGSFFLFFNISIFAGYMIKLFKKTNFYLSNLSLGFLLSIISILIFGMIETVLTGFETGLLLWSLMGIGLGIYSRNKTAKYLKK